MVIHDMVTATRQPTGPGPAGAAVTIPMDHSDYHSMIAI